MEQSCATELGSDAAALALSKHFSAILAIAALTP